MYLARSSPTVLTWFMDASLSGLQRPHSGTPRPPGASTPSRSHQADVVVRVERDTARSASIALGSEEVLPPSGQGASLQSPPPPLVPVRPCVGVQGTAASPDLDVADDLGVAVPGQHGCPRHRCVCEVPHP